MKFRSTNATALCVIQLNLTSSFKMYTVTAFSFCPWYIQPSSLRTIHFSQLVLQLRRIILLFLELSHRRLHFKSLASGIFCPNMSSAGVIPFVSSTDDLQTIRNNGIRWSHSVQQVFCWTSWPCRQTEDWETLSGDIAATRRYHF